MQLATAYDAPVDARLARLATRQHSIVSRNQLLTLGLTNTQISRRVAMGRLHRLYRGVFAVGHVRLTQRGHWLAAVVACRSGGGESVLSHRAAGQLHGILRSAPSNPIDVIATRRHQLRGVRCHGVRGLHPDDITIVDAIPVTTVHRAFLDLAEVMHPLRLFDALELSVRRELFDLTQLRAMIARNPGGHGLKPLQEQLARLTDAPAWLDSRLEAEFLFRLRQHPDLPEPLTRQVVEGEPVDFYWPDHRVVLEIDGERYHWLPRDRLNDARRDRKLTLAGYAVLRVSEREFKADPERVIAELRALLRRQAP
jgi:very-short-patch-repair endonuclease